MVNKMVLFVVDLTINEGSFDQFESVVQAMTAASRKEPGTLGYEWCLSDDRKRCRLIEVYADENAMIAHMSGPAVQELVPKALETASIAGFDVYGDLGPEGAKIMAQFGVEIFAPWHGLGR